MWIHIVFKPKYLVKFYHVLLQRESRKKPEHRLALDKLNLMKRIGVKTSSSGSARKCKSPPPPTAEKTEEGSPRPTHHRYV